ncbi:MAG: TIGR03619 family F420-dependent LLM class oxidoreductase [Acidimicrobiia bacterium]
MGDAVSLSVTVSGLSRLFGDDPGAVVETARTADELGVDQIVLPDHVAIGPRLDRYPYSSRFPYPPSEPWLEPLTTLAAIAGATRRVRLGTGVLIAPLRPVLVLAKTVATLDVLSRGRVDLGIGTGWQREEFVEPGMGFAGRTGRMDDAVAACRALWEREPPVSFHSGTIAFEDLWCEPRPVQARLPVWYGGALTPPMVERIATLGDGWLPLGPSIPEIAVGIAVLRDAFERHGRDPSTLGVRVGLPVVTDADGAVDAAGTVGDVDTLAAMGVTSVSVALGRFIRTRGDVEPFLSALVAVLRP